MTDNGVPHPSGFNSGGNQARSISNHFRSYKISNHRIVRSIFGLPSSTTSDLFERAKAMCRSTASRGVETSIVDAAVATRRCSVAFISQHGPER